MANALLPLTIMLAACAPGHTDDGLEGTGASAMTSSRNEAGAPVAASKQLAQTSSPSATTARPTLSTQADGQARTVAGRRTLSTAYVRVGPDGLLTVQMHGGKVLILRNVVLRPADYCGTLVSGAAARKFCGNYADIAAARPGADTAAEQPDLARANPLPT